MTDKVQKILSKIATRKLCTMDEHMAFYNDKAKEDYEFLCEIEEFMKALLEEPVSEDLEEEINRYLSYRNSSPQNPIEFSRDLARHFANWQKEQMMSKAIDTTIKQGFTDLGIFIKGLDKNKFSFGDKVKVIVIKEG